VGEAIRLMAVGSDNALAHLVRDLVGDRHVDQHLARLALRRTSVARERLSTSAWDMALLGAAIARGYPSQRASADVRELLQDQWIRDRIPAGIADESAAIANKTGDWTGAAHDVAIVEASAARYSIAILTDGTYANAFFRNVAAAVHAYLTAAGPG